MGNYHNLAIGRLGEEVAKKFLEQKGYKIIEQNYKTKYAEIDLIACYKNLLIFVEVRSKIGEMFGSPEDTLNKRKINKIVWNCLNYIQHKGAKQDYRIDAVCVVLDKNRELKRISHYEDVSF